MRLRSLIPALLVAVLVLPAGAAAAETVIVEMRTVNAHPVFLPAEVTIHPGDTVRWINLDLQLEHATASGGGSADPDHGALWESGMLRYGEYFEYTFEETGDFAYYSVPHEYEGMLGLVRVATGTAVPEMEVSTWGLIKQQFAELLPRE